MKLNQEVNDIVIFGEDNSKKAKISENKLAKLQYLLTKGLYKDPISAVIVEWTNNGIDGVVQSGKDPIKHPVIVKINTINNKTFFTVKDNGVGLDKDDFENVCMNYLESTKENDNNTIGHFGLGMKSFLSLERPATFICIKDGRKRKYIVYEGQEFVNYELIIDEPTLEENGVECSIEILNYSEKINFISKAKQKLAYYDTAVLLIDDEIVENIISRNDLFQISTLNTYNEIHLCLKDVVYKIDWDALGIKPIYLSLALRFGLESGLKPTPSRESYITNQFAKDLILDKLSKISEFFVNTYNEKIPDSTNFVDGYDFINVHDFNVQINNTNFKINELFNYSSVIIKKPKFEGLFIFTPEYYKNISHKFNYNYEKLCVLDKYGSWKKVRYHNSIFNSVIDGRKIILTDKLPIGRIKSFLLKKYKSDVIFIKKNDYLLTNYKYNLNLKNDSRNKWREQIKEYQYILSLLEQKMTEYFDIENSKEFIDFLIDASNKRKEDRKNKPIVRNSSTLNKQNGDITLSFARYNNLNKIVFDKKVVKISTLNKMPHYIVYGIDKEEMKKFAEQVHKSIKVCLVSKREVKHLNNIHNFSSMEKFISEGNKKFRKMVTCQLIKDTLDDYNKSLKNTSINKYLSSLDKDINVLSFYVKNNDCTLNGDFKQAMMTLANEQNLWDYSIYHIVKRVKDNNNILKLSKFLSIPSSNEPENIKKEYSNLINQFVLFNKLHKDEFKDFDIVKVIPKKVITPEYIENMENILDSIEMI